MINFRLIYKVLGQLLLLEASMMLICLGLAFFYNEDDILGFAITIAIVIISALLLKYKGRNASNSMSRRDAYLLITLTWTLFSLFGALPFTISGYIRDFTDAYFETMSGFTTTGATIIDDVEALPHGLLFWRSMTQWIGGLGIAFFTIAILPSLVGGNMRVFAAESTGPIRSKIHPRISSNAKSIWLVYLLLTVGCMVSLYIAGMNAFDSTNYSMSITATGGFAPYNDSTGHFHSAAIDYTSVIFMFLSGTNFTLLYLAILKGRIKSLLHDSEFKLYSFIVFLSTMAIMYFLVFHNDYNFIHAFRSALFQVVSFITTTGVFNDDAGKWPHITWVILSICMFIGACAGSTSGGFKSVRGVILLKVIRNELKRILHPKAVLPVRVNGNIVSGTAQVTLLVFFALYMALCLFAYFCLICMGIDSTNAITIAMSCASNVGPTLGLEIGPTTSWSILPDLGKWICSILMLMGRLEIFSVIVLFTRSFWKDH